MSSPNLPRRVGAPQRPAVDLAATPGGGRTWSQRAPLHLVLSLDAEAARDHRPRGEMVRVLLWEAIEARRIARLGKKAKAGEIDACD